MLYYYYYYLKSVVTGSLCIVPFGLQVCVESENLKVAFSLFEEMKKYQIRPNLVSA